MTMYRKVVPAQVSALGDDEVEVVMSTASLARDSHVLVPEGCQLDHYRANPIVLWQHDPEHPIANNEDVQIGAGNITARTKFAPAGISHKADEIRGLVKAGIVRTVSVGFDPIEMEPLDPKKPRGGQRITKWELLEMSFCSVPVDTGAVVTARAEKAAAEWKVGASRNLPVQDSDEWDGAAAEKSIFAWAGGDDFDPKKARKAFLFYDAANPKERGSYKDPIAHVVDGRLQVPKGAIRAAASRLPQTDVPEKVKDEAKSVLDHYKEKAGMSDASETKDKDRAAAVPMTRAHLRTIKPKFTRGLYEVASLAYMLEQLGYAKNSAEWEKALEGDDSEVPAQLGEVCIALGEALCAMTKEEVDELLENVGATGDDAESEDGLVTREDRAFINAAPSVRAKAWRRGIVAAKTRAGKKLSAETVRCLRAALVSHDDGMDHHRAAMRAHKEAAGQIQDLMDRAGVPAAEPGAEDGDSAKTQTSSGTGENTGEETRSADWRRRQADVLALTAH